MFETVNPQKPTIKRDELINILLNKTPKVIQDLIHTEEDYGLTVNGYYVPYGIRHDWKSLVRKKDWSFREPIWEPVGMDSTGKQVRLRFSMLDILSAKRRDEAWIVDGMEIIPLKAV
jgi:hypothetical protein